MYIILHIINIIHVLKITVMLIIEINSLNFNQNISLIYTLIEIICILTYIFLNINVIQSKYIIKIGTFNLFIYLLYLLIFFI